LIEFNQNYQKKRRFSAQTLARHGYQGDFAHENPQKTISIIILRRLNFKNCAAIFQSKSFSKTPIKAVPLVRA